MARVSFLKSAFIVWPCCAISEYALYSGDQLCILIAPFWIFGPIHVHFYFAF